MPSEPTADEIRAAEGDDLSRLFHRIVLGDDLSANTEERRIGVELMRRYVTAPKPVPMGIDEWLWRNREGQPWQADLEASVAA